MTRAHHSHGLIRHYAEMVMAMYAGMILLGGLAGGIISLSGSTPEHVRYAAPEAFGLIMALNMSIPMVVWMRHRGQRPRLVAEMLVAMVAPAVAAIVLFWCSVIHAEAICPFECSLMLLTMLAAMLYRRSEYTAASGSRTTTAVSRGRRAA